MSAPAIKSSMPGVGASPSSAGHSVLPMNMMAQKVVPGTESNSGMKPLNTSGLSYVTLQPPNHPQQPLSLVQDHRPPVYQAQPSTYTSNNAEKETDSDKVIANGVESSKVQTEQEQNCPIKSTEPSRNNNMSPETPSQEQQTQEKKQLESQSETETAVKPETTPGFTFFLSLSLFDKAIMIAKNIKNIIANNDYYSQNGNQGKVTKLKSTMLSDEKKLFTE